MFGDDRGTTLDGSIEERGQLFARFFGTCCVDLSVLASHIDTVQTVQNPVNSQWTLCTKVGATVKTKSCHFERSEKSAFCAYLKAADFSPGRAGFEMTALVGGHAL